MKKTFIYFLVTILMLTGVTSISGIKVQAAGKTMYVTASELNVRQSGSTKAKIITTVKKNAAVTVTQTTGAWSKVNVNNKTGWVSNQYLITKKPATAKATTPAKTTTTTKYVTATTLNVRSGAGTTYKVVTSVKKSITGWVSNQYLTTKKPSAPKNLAEGLKTVGSNKQLILVTTNGSSTSNADIRTFEKNSKGQWVPVLTIKGYVGKLGFATPAKMSEGGKKAPTGKYTIGTAFGTKANPGTKLPYRKITSDDVWVDDPASKLYNTWQSKSKTKGQWKSAENMNISAYTYGFVINYNKARTPGKGSAIFFHLAGNYNYTLGCTATTQANVVKILKWLDPAKKPVIIQTPIQDLSKY